MAGTEAAARCSTESDELVIRRAAHVEVGVAPSVEFARAAQRLAGADATGAFAGVVDDANGDVKAALQIAQMREQRGDVARDVFVDPAEADEGVEDEELGLEGLDGGAEA